LRRRCLQFALPGFLAFSTLLPAQSAAPDTESPVPSLTSNAQAVVVDVVVTRRNDEPVAGLHQQDFQVLEDGKPRAGGNTHLAGPLTRFEVDLAINPAGVALDPAPEGAHTGKIELAIVAYDQAGKAVNWTGQTLALILNPSDYAQVLRSAIPVHLQIDLPSADLFLTTGVYDLATHKAGTLEISLQPQSAAESSPSPTSEAIRQEIHVLERKKQALNNASHLAD
jgi:hypothetical protein